ncbi:M48 family metallopeptidase [Patescibacteria group bacterium]|nr:M48 family metallopeptidase [Patescibacteria group bacterium]
MPTLYSLKDSNIHKTWLLMFFFSIFVIGLGWLFSVVYNSWGILIFAIGFSVIYNLFSYWNADKIALALSGAHALPREQSESLYQTVENLSITMGLPMPALYIINDPSPNAFATGRDPHHSSVAVTVGLLRMMDNDELEGVLAHEMSHIGNRDILVSTIAVMLVGVVAMLGDLFLRISFWGGERENNNNGGVILLVIGVAAAILAPLAAMLIQLAISRRREGLADATGVLTTRYPEGLIGALKKIEAYGAGMRRAQTATAHLYFANPFGADKAHRKVSWFAKLFMTHPPIDERIAALEKMANISA